MYEACTGRLPFDADNTDSIVHMQLHNQPIPPRHLNPAVDDELNAIILKAMEKEPHNRYTTAMDTQQDLVDYLSASTHLENPISYPQFWVIGFTQAPSNLRGTMHKIEAPAIIGRDERADVVVPEESLSRSHARITPMGLYLEVEDLDSSNGTIVDGKHIKRPILCKPGSVIELGNVRLRVGNKR